MYRIIDIQCEKYFWDGHIFKDKKEIIEALADFHDIDFHGINNEDEEKISLLEWLKKYVSTDVNKQLEWLQDYGEWEIEKVESEEES